MADNSDLSSCPRYTDITDIVPDGDGFALWVTGQDGQPHCMRMAASIIAPLMQFLLGTTRQRRADLLELVRGASTALSQSQALLEGETKN